jgi:putative transposase
MAFRAFGVLRLLSTLLQLLSGALHPRAALAAENLVLRRQLALYRERNLKARKPDRLTRFTLAYLSRFFNWREALVIVQPRTLIAWRRAGFRLLWRWQSKPGRPLIPIEVRG